MCVTFIQTNDKNIDKINRNIVVIRFSLFALLTTSLFLELICSFQRPTTSFIFSEEIMKRIAEIINSLVRQVRSEMLQLDQIPPDLIDAVKERL